MFHLKCNFEIANTKCFKSLKHNCVPLQYQGKFGFWGLWNIYSLVSCEVHFLRPDKSCLQWPTSAWRQSDVWFRTFLHIFFIVFGLCHSAKALTHYMNEGVMIKPIKKLMSDDSPQRRFGWWDPLRRFSESAWGSFFKETLDFLNNWFCSFFSLISSCGLNLFSWNGREDVWNLSGHKT